VALGLPDAVCDGEADFEALGVNDGDSEAVADGLPDFDADGEALFESLGDADGDAEAE
jgi:hypothetical protein